MSIREELNTKLSFIVAELCKTQKKLKELEKAPKGNGINLPIQLTDVWELSEKLESIWDIIERIIFELKLLAENKAHKSTDNLSEDDIDLWRQKLGVGECCKQPIGVWANTNTRIFTK